MNWTLLKRVVWYLVISRIPVFMQKSPDFTVFDEMTELKELCPYSSFCGQNVSSEFQISDKFKPCCDSCSCKSDCSFQGTCCFNDESDYIGGQHNMICRHTFAFEFIEYEGIFGEIVNNSPHYKMIDKCGSFDLMTQISDEGNQRNFLDSYRSFSPVYSATKGYIFVNSFFAQCNNVSDAIPWRRAVLCTPEAELSLSEFMENFDTVNMSDYYSRCLPYYIPPSEASLDNLLCYPNVIRHCNITLKMKTREPFWDNCGLFNATFTVKSFGTLQAYANVYCFMCNTNTDKEKIKTLQCPKQSPGSDQGKIPPIGSVPLTILLDMMDMEPILAAEVSDDRKDCPRNTRLVSSFQKSCRPLKCPIGQFLRNNRCDYYSKVWIGGPFAAVLRLSPIEKDISLSTSFFKNMPEHMKFDTKADWLKRKTLRKWNLVVLYHPSEDQDSVEYLIIKAFFPFQRVNPHVLRDTVTKALKDEWKIEFQNFSMSFKVSLNEHSEYSRLFADNLKAMTGINVTDTVGYLPRVMVCLNPVVFDYKMLLFPVTYFRHNLLEERTLITKLFFCDQVVLLPEEFEQLTCLRIFLTVRNTTINTFSTTNQVVSDISSNYSASISEKKSITKFLVCLHEFDEQPGSGLEQFQNRGIKGAVTCVDFCKLMLVICTLWSM